MSSDTVLLGTPVGDPVIEVESLGKEYVIGRREEVNGTFRDLLASSLAAPFRRLRTLTGHVEAEERFWALKDVSFEVNEGEVVGIIGRNGAGKSTLLKILSRITVPTSGRAVIRGRLGSLLEVGTGFHPELTGRENIYLNGAILGMRHVEIDRKLDEIIEFSGIRPFIDTPVKRYSSGMRVRLAFAVAAHLDPEILIIDEVLAVGDVGFQEKCLNKMEESTRQGRTILFVSHNLTAVQTLCNRGIVLTQGCLDFDGTQTNAIAHYHQTAESKRASVAGRGDRSGTGHVRVTQVEVFNAEGEPVSTVASGDQVSFRILYQNTAGKK